MPLRFNYTCDFLKDLHFSKIISIQNLDNLLKAFVKINFFDWSTKENTWLLVNSHKRFQSCFDVEELSFNDYMEQFSRYATVGSFRQIEPEDCLGALALNQESRAKQNLLKIFCKNLMLQIAANDTPNVLICIDSDLKNLNAMQAACLNSGIKFLGILHKNLSLNNSNFPLTNSDGEFVQNKKKNSFASFAL